MAISQVDAATHVDPAANLAAVSARLRGALAEADRPADATRIVAVSKKHDLDRIMPVIDAGCRSFGENRVQEAKAKWPSIKERYTDLRLHLVGPLQSNKAADAVALFDVIETIDREKIARVVGEEMQRQGRSPTCLVQVNTGEEPQKAGVAPSVADEFIRRCRDEHGLRVDGVMCIPPIDEPPAPHFALLAKIAERNRLSIVSMGMSADFEIAAQLGATHVRIGSEIFGPRPE
ncbi:MAG: YggS family pyridoxal phosphate-dependent enzyme [Alphaproteobacteria bacterium]|nr:YggS family pyridoxal phosphate-dependent enzyme [Alphaproteobacteria bacterium]